MPRGRPQGGASVVDRWDDGKFVVTIYTRGARFRVVAGFRGGGSAEKSSPDLDEARALADGFWRAYQRGDIEAPEVEPATLAELATAIETKPGLKPKTRRSYAQVWRLFAKHVGEKRPPRRVYRLDVQGFLDAVEALTYSPKESGSARTIETYLRTLRAGFRWAMKRRWLLDDPTLDIEVDATHALGPWLPYSEWERYLTDCQPSHEVRSGFVLETGLRESELLHARPEWIRGDIGRRGIYVAKDEVTGFDPKGGPRIVPLTDKAEWWLKRAAKLWTGSRFLFCGDDGVSATGNLSRETRAAVQRSGVTRTTFHGLRRSAGAHWLECGLSLYEVSRLLGHADIRTTQQWYADICDSGLVAAIAQVERARREDAERDLLADVVPLGTKLFAVGK